jgi:carbonic anhydrase/acetyltransferase-like protein (isoleucine patch superfamily)
MSDEHPALVAPFEESFPEIDETVFLAPGAVVTGDVRIGSEASLWYHAVARGDVHWIRIGAQSNIQDHCVLHVTHDTHPLRIGSRVTVGHRATLHGCSIEDECLIGMGSIVLDGAVVESHAMVAAGALVPPRFRVPAGMLVAGVPARVVRKLSTEEQKDIGASADRYVGYAKRTRASLESRAD